MDEVNVGENPELDEAVEIDTVLKTLIVNHVGDQLNPENEEVTVQMIVEVFSKEFPEFLLAVAEENWIRGYHQAFVDIEEGEKLMKENEDTTSTTTS